MISIAGVDLSPVELAVTAMTILGLLLILNALLNNTPDVLGGIANYGEPGWGDASPSGSGRHLANTEVAQFSSARSPLLRVFAAWRDGHKRKQSRPGTVLSPAARKLALAQLQLSPTEWVMVRLAVCGAAAALLTIRMGSPLLGGGIGAAVGFFATRFYINMRVGKRQKKFEKQLVDVIGVIGSGMRAGSTFSQALEYVAGHIDAPAGPEFARLSREAQLGIPMDECLFHLAERNESNELKLLVNALIVNRRVGGNLSTILEILANTIRMRIKIKGDVKTLTAQASFSGWIISLLPVALLLLLMGISPAYVGPMFTTGIGIGMLIGGGVMISLGMFVMRAVTKVKI